MIENQCITGNITANDSVKQFGYFRIFEGFLINLSYVATDQLTALLPGILLLFFIYIYNNPFLITENQADGRLLYYRLKKFVSFFQFNKFVKNGRIRQRFFFKLKQKGNVFLRGEDMNGICPRLQYYTFCYSSFTDNLRFENGLEGRDTFKEIHSLLLYIPLHETAAPGSYIDNTQIVLCDN